MAPREKLSLVYNAGVRYAREGTFKALSRKTAFLMIADGFVQFGPSTPSSVTKQGHRRKSATHLALEVGRLSRPVPGRTNDRANSAQEKAAPEKLMVGYGFNAG